MISAFQNAGIRIGKIHLSSALQVAPDEAGRTWLQRFANDTYLHQVIARTRDGSLHRYMDLDLALGQQAKEDVWRIHFHVPLYATSLEHGQTTMEHLLDLLAILKQNPNLCSHLEIETYTWDVLPMELRANTAVDQLVQEYKWCFDQLGKT